MALEIYDESEGSLAHIGEAKVNAKGASATTLELKLYDHSFTVEIRTKPFT